MRRAGGRGDLPLAQLGALRRPCPGVLWQRAASRAPVPSACPAGPPFPWWNGAYDEQPCKPVIAGKASNGSLLYVGRTWHNGNLLPVQIDTEYYNNLVAWNRRVYRKMCQQFEVLHLLRGRAEWIEASDGDIPAQAFPVGITSSGRKVFVASITRRGITAVGRVVEGDSCSYIPYRYEERTFKNYAVLAVL
ncbi:hypothetical protein R5R35_003029 [Gryllus longicercus]|uniref:Uncharacterized protein n=1 Tax=Gryllus longicercus TaxID=2509291 RepID=A0AAN9ZA26_9ORTH